MYEQKKDGKQLFHPKQHTQLDNQQTSSLQSKKEKQTEPKKYPWLLYNASLQ